MANDQNTAEVLSSVSVPRRRWFRFSLRSLIVAAVLICLIAGWQGNRWRQQRELESLILFINGKGHYANADKFIFGYSASTLPSWMSFLQVFAIEDIHAIDLLDEIGEDPQETFAIARRARMLSLSGIPAINKATLAKCLGENTQSVNISRSKMTPDALAGISSYPDIHTLEVWYIDLEMLSLQAIAEHPNLVAIQFQTKVENLLQIPSFRCDRTLREFTLTAVPDEEVLFYDRRGPVAEFTIGIAQLRFLEKCGDLERLVIRHPVHSNAVPWIAEHFPKLRSVTLTNSSLTDDAVVALLELPHLEYVDLNFHNLSGHSQQAVKHFLRSK